MRVRNYSVIVGTGVENSTTEVEVVDGEPFTVTVGNHGHKRCTVAGTVAGTPVAATPVPPHDTLVLSAGGKPGFVCRAGGGAVPAGGKLPAGDHDVIALTFTPDKAPPRAGGAGKTTRPAADGPVAFNIRLKVLGRKVAQTKE